jgi:hypothetical protein
VALTDKQKHEVVRYLGWSGKTLISDSTHYNSIVNSRLINLNSIIEAEVIGLLARLDSIVEQMDAARCRLSASEVGDIVLNQKELEMLRKEYMRWIRELSDLLDISIEKSGAGVNVGVVV